MKSPYADANAVLKKEKRSFDYRKDSFEILYHFYVCEQTQEEFTDTELDIININQVHHKYRDKYGIPFTDEIKMIREEYGLSAAKMSEILGLGANVYRQYESGEMPSVATGRLIRLATDPQEFNKLLEMSAHILEVHEYEKVRKKIDHAMSGWGIVEKMQQLSLFESKYPSLYNGYRVPDLRRIGRMVQYFAKWNTPYTTALNKLMFYADFGHFKRHGQSISGLQYKAIQRGPVPRNFGGIYNQLYNLGYVSIQEKVFGDYVGEIFVVNSEQENQLGETNVELSNSEQAMLEEVSNLFKNKSTKEIVRISHEELAWRDNVDDFNLISFEYGFGLKSIQ